MLWHHSRRRYNTLFMKHMAYIALGSNIEPRAQTLIKALTLLDAQPGVAVGRVSQFIETEPVSSVEQGKFLNGAAQITTDLQPRELIGLLHEIEAKLGRNRAKEQHWGPRTCDLDLLLFDDLIINEPELVIPHPRMHERVFVLKPLCQIAPDVEHPVVHKTISAMLAEREGH
jgi:2-amino-4-hydroxy-6-hydroxymethyldihydropteridine diphosphokinase